MSGPATSGQVQTSLLDQPIELKLTNATFLYALSTLAVDKRVPIGFEPQPFHRAEYNVNLDVKNVKLADALDILMKQQPNYRWELRDGVINIVPAESRDSVVEGFLSTRIQVFKPPKGDRWVVIREAILDLPEVQSFLIENGISASRYGYFSRYPSIYTNKELDLSTSQTDVRGLLNKVVLESEHKMWIASRSGKNLESLDLGF